MKDRYGAAGIFTPRLFSIGNMKIMITIADWYCGKCSRTADGATRHPRGSPKND